MEQPNPSAVPSEASDDGVRDQIDATLHRLGVHDGWPDHRRALAVQCDVHGITPADILLIAERVAAQRKQTSDSTAAIVAVVLKDPKEALRRITDLRRGQTLRPVHIPTTHPGLIDRQRSREALEAERKAWHEADRQHFIRCRIADGITEEQAASEWQARNTPAEEKKPC